MAQEVKNIDEQVQKKMLEVLQSGDFRAEFLFGFQKTQDGVVPLIIISNEVPNGEAIVKNIYAMFDAVFNFKLINQATKTKK